MCFSCCMFVLVSVNVSTIIFPEYYMNVNLTLIYEEVGTFIFFTRLGGQFFRCTLHSQRPFRVFLRVTVRNMCSALVSTYSLTLVLV